MSLADERRRFLAERGADIATWVGIRLWPVFFDILQCPARELIAIGGWRAGKSTIAALFLFMDLFWKGLLRGETGLLYWLVGPDYEQARQEFLYVEAWAGKLGLISGQPGKPEEGQWTLKLALPGRKPFCTIETKSGAKSERLGSVAPDGIIGCEAGQLSESVRLMLLGRAAEKRAWIFYAGTLEDDKGKEIHYWYQEKSALWRDGGKCENADRHVCALEHNAISIPTWTNLAVFPGGENDPEIERLRIEYDPFTFRRYIAAEPTGVQFQIYPQSTAKRTKLLIPMNAAVLGQPIIMAAGGIDYGTTEGHPSVLVVGQVVPDQRDNHMGYAEGKGIVWVREVIWQEDERGDAEALRRARRELTQRWRVGTWITDPNERFMAKSFLTDTTSYSQMAREARVGLVTARFNLNKIYFDLDGPGVVRLYDQFEKVHRRRQADGQMMYVRNQDDGVAACENMVEAIDGKPHVNLRELVQKRTFPKRREKSYRVRA